jgi:hypothetical protein
MEAPQVAEFRQYVLEGVWDTAEDLLASLGVSDPADLLVRAYPHFKLTLILIF